MKTSLCTLNILHFYLKLWFNNVVKTNPINNISYQGIPIASYKVCEEKACYKLYDINHKDKDFLYKMYDAIKLPKLMKNLEEYDYTLWDEMIKNAIRLTNTAGHKSLLETYNNIPCGIMNYKDVGNKYHLNYVATFPIEVNKRVPCAGQILFNELLNRFTQSDKNRIELSAIRTAPFDPISTYLKLGFKMEGGSEYNEYMGINKERAARALLNQENFITKAPIKNKENIDLDKELKLDYIF